MKFYDQHLHSHNSFDSKALPEDVVACAIEANLAGITFTEHFDTHPEEWDDCVFDYDKISREIDALRERFGDRIYIGKGIEVCYQPERLPFILDFLNEHTFDCILLSVHWAAGKPVHVKRHFEGMDAHDFVENYLQEVARATAKLVEMKQAGYQPFQILGHMDYAKRYANRYYDQAVHSEATPLVDEILHNCLEAGIIPEINTSTLRNNMDEPMPGPAVVNRYAQLGGTMMSLGSDAHTAKKVGSHLNQAADLMRAAGIKQLAVFKHGKLEPVALDGV